MGAGKYARMMRRRQVGPPLPDVFTFKTTATGSFSFTINQTHSIVFADLGDGSGYVAGTNTTGTTWQWTTTYSSSAEKTVSIAVNAFASVTGLGNFSSKNITEFDAGSLNNLTGNLTFNNNTALTMFGWPTNNNTNGLVVLNFTSCNLTGVQDLSGISGFNTGSQFLFANNGNATQYIFASSMSSGRMRGSFSNNNITGVFNCTGFTALNNDLTLSNNPLLTGILIPAGTGSMQLFAANCNLTGVLDLTQHTRFNQLYLNDNPLLTGVLVTSLTACRFRAQNCNLSGTLDLSSFPVGIEVNLQGNSLLTSVIFQSSGNNPINNVLNISNCNLTGNLDLSALTIGQTSNTIQNNPLLTTINCFTTVTNCSFNASGCNLGVADYDKIVSPGLEITNGRSLDLTDNGMNVSEVNEVLDIIDNALSTITYTGSSSIFIAGTNAAPDTTSGGFNGVAAKASLQAKGYVVTTN